jgi:transcription-repair coupling factor (superfamily II helicase)
MKLNLLTPLREHPTYRQLLTQLATVRDGRRFAALTLDVLEAARPYLLAALHADWGGPILFVTGTPAAARQLAEQVQSYADDPAMVRHYPAPDTIFYDRTPWDRETIQARATLLTELAAQNRGAQSRGAQSRDAERRSDPAAPGLFVTASIWSLMAKTVTPRALLRARQRLAQGQVVPMYAVIEGLVRAGYDRVPVVEEPGTFAHRGSLVDVYPPGQRWPLRIDFFGDEIDSIRTFDPGTQRTREALAEVLLPPASEALPEWGLAARAALESWELGNCTGVARARYQEDREHLLERAYFRGIEYYAPYLYPNAATLTDYMPANALVLVDDLLTLETAALGLENQATSLRADMTRDGDLPANFAVAHFTWEELKARLAGAVSLGYGQQDPETPIGRLFVAAPHFGGQLEDGLAEAVRLSRQGQRVVMVSRQAERLASLLQQQQLSVAPAQELPALPAPGSLSLIDGVLNEGWALPAADLLLLTDAEIFGWVRKQRRREVAPRQAAPEALFADLQEGDYVVHLEYGIGVYRGLVRKSIGGVEREYLELGYEQGDRLFVPIHQADRVSRYLGADERQPRIHRLGGTEWTAVREKAEQAIRDIARDLLELYAAREVTPGMAFAPDTEWQHELEASFAYEETDDQLRALAEIKADMERPKPMDRLVCGDVGYGKTEVALRAAFKAVMDGKQVAVLVPTTILAQQHYYTFRNRLRAFPLHVEMLSRFRSPGEQDDVILGLMDGTVDIVIGTHRLLSQDVSFKDLGLVVVDEEQRFGVTHKERLKQLRREVDVLTMTATPIPRTLYMSLSGIRDMSIIDTAPENRLAVRTVVLPFEESAIRTAILREIDRNGQVYFVHNRVQDIDLVAAALHRIVPEASVVIGHGQMDEDELAQVMLDFAQGQYHVLLCTTIIESGLDIPNVNTIIVDDADHFGLAQLYQLRGRVGRGMNRGYAYLLYRPPLTEIATKRLQAIQEASELGAGLRVAMRDMEIRGAGEILGAEQHGHINAIGFDLYSRLLRRAVQEIRDASGESLEAVIRAQHRAAVEALSLDLGPSIDLPLSAYLPDGFIPDAPLRLRLYRRLAHIKTLDDVAQIRDELRDRFGALPELVEDLFYLLEIKARAEQVGVIQVKSADDEVALVLPILLTDSALARLNRQPGVRARGSRVWLQVDEDWRQRLTATLSLMDRLELAPLTSTRSGS